MLAQNVATTTIDLKYRLAILGKYPWPYQYSGHSPLILTLKFSHYWQSEKQMLITNNPTMVKLFIEICCVWNFRLEQNDTFKFLCLHIYSYIFIDQTDTQHTLWTLTPFSKGKAIMNVFICKDLHLRAVHRSRYHSYAEAFNQSVVHTQKVGQCDVIPVIICQMQSFAESSMNGKIMKV